MSSAFRPFDYDLEPTGSEGRKSRENGRAAFRKAVEHGFRGRPLTAEDVADWHRQLFAGLSLVPDPCYLGGYRGSAHPWLHDYEIDLGAVPLAAAAEVAAELTRFLAELERRMRQFAHREGGVEIREVVQIAVWAHGEWLRIHPFANGNGRTARLIANFVLARYGLPPLMAIRPRPQPPYLEISTASIHATTRPQWNGCCTSSSRTLANDMHRCDRGQDRLSLTNFRSRSRP